MMGLTMQVTETLSEGLKRAYDVVIPASDLASRLDSELADLKRYGDIEGAFFYVLPRLRQLRLR